MNIPIIAVGLWVKAFSLFEIFCFDCKYGIFGGYPAGYYTAIKKT